MTVTSETYNNWTNLPLGTCDMSNVPHPKDCNKGIKCPNWKPVEEQEKVNDITPSV